VFGSRAKNTARFNSDLDLAIEASQGRALPKDTLPRLKDAFNDAPLSYRVDVLDLTEASDDFQAIIRKQAVAFPLPQTDNVPKLRFLEFKSSWKNTSLGKVSGKPAYGMNAAACEFDGKHKYIRITDISDQERAYRPKPLTSPEPPISADYALRAGDIVFTRTGASTGKSYLYKEADGELYFAGFLIRFSIKGAVPAFVFAQTLRSDYENWVSVASTRSGQPGINAQEYAGYKFSIPPLPEQSKIASFLEAADAKITQLSRKKALLEDYKKGCMQQLFSQKIRFRDDEGNDFPDWEDKRLEEVFDRVRQKNSVRNENVLTISAQNGLVSQLDYFNHSVAAKDTSGYYLLEKGDFAYNKSYSKGYPMGAIKRLNFYERGIVSTLYICFRSRISGAEDFFECYFNSGFQNKWLAKISQEGARNHGLLNMAIEDVFDMPLPYPHPAEQRKIADFLSALDRKIELVAQELTYTRSFKAGLLQQMFV
jgi:type I restriction enzyme S subunit